MKKYEIFKRTSWKKNPNYPGGKEPGFGRKTHIQYVFGIDKAREVCQQYNTSNEAAKNKFGLKYEFQSV